MKVVKPAGFFPGGDLLVHTPAMNLAFSHRLEGRVSKVRPTLTAIPTA